MNLQTREQRQADVCDVVLVAEGGKEFKARRDVLCKASPFFEKLLTNGMKESKEGVVQLTVLNESLMHSVLHFIDNDDVEISTPENAEALIVAADYLLLPSLKTLAGRFLEKTLSPSNCVSTYLFAQTYNCAELVIRSVEFIHANIVAISEYDEFLNLESQEIEKWISSDDISVSAEEDVFNIILRWIGHDKNQRKEKFMELFRHLRLIYISRDFLEENVVTNEFVKENADCLKHVLEDTVQWMKSPSSDQLPYAPRKDLELDALVVSRGQSILCYIPRKDKWFRLLKSCCCAVVSCRGRLYSFEGKHRVNFQTEHSDYNSSNHDWKHVEGNLPENHQIVLSVRDDIFCYKSSWAGPDEPVFKYNIATNSWSTTPAFFINTTEASCLVSEDKYIYKIGGCIKIGERAEWVLLSEAQRIDPGENKWEKISPLQQARHSAFGVGAHGRVYVAGGMAANKLLQTCEVYNVLTDEWQFIASLSAPRMNGALAWIGGSLYALSGKLEYFRNINAAYKTVECYNPDMKTWEKKTRIPQEIFLRKEHGRHVGRRIRVSSAKLLKSVIDKLEPI